MGRESGQGGERCNQSVWWQTKARSLGHNTYPILLRGDKRSRPREMPERNLGNSRCERIG